MTRSYTKTGQVVRTNVQKYMLADPSLTEEQAYELYKEDMRQRGSKGGKAHGGAFNYVPGLAKRAARIPRKKK